MRDDIIYYKMKNPADSKKAKGKLVIRPDCFQVFVDIDKQEDLAIYDKAYSILKKEAGLEEEKRVASPSGGTHIYLRARQPISQIERLLLQACLGSDRVRETLAYIQLLTGQNPEVASCFFENKPNQEVKNE